MIKEWAQYLTLLYPAYLLGRIASHFTWLQFIMLVIFGSAIIYSVIMYYKEKRT